eukprot:CAMPEP_0116015368 /NCGR_PEP_ID=MMETSP0321-20121206/6803_1 /TAXON_ID=163516 /ORGANISM="Leptocylindrus danicus var. danicus, Strain B650" /LENGTH=448 /DNA_ID=CAMNT_0003485141 /DNA_START=82 /DNA_END=1428 /DNA_ORIENTATION=+
MSSIYAQLGVALIAFTFTPGVNSFSMAGCGQQREISLSKFNVRTCTGRFSIYAFGTGRQYNKRLPEGTLLRAFKDEGDIDEEDFQNNMNIGPVNDQIANSRLPISYRSDYDGSRDEEFDVGVMGENTPSPEEVGLVPSQQNLQPQQEKADVENNPYVEVVSRLSPSELIGRFTATASPKVQEAVKTTILGLIGTLPKVAFETTTVTTGARLASLMFQLQMSGYMFKNAEYRMSLSKSLGSAGDRVKGGLMFDDGVIVDAAKAKVKGKVKVSYSLGDFGNSDSNDGDDGENASEDAKFEVEVDANAYMSELRDEVTKLREELSAVREAKEEEVRQDLLAYIRTLPEQQMQQLTSSISGDVMGAMRGLVNVVMQGIGDGQITPNTVTEQSSEAMAQLCMWQLVVGYNLRELEVREEMKNNLLSIAAGQKSNLKLPTENNGEDVENSEQND